MFDIGNIITDKYNRFYKVVEKIEKSAENGEKYALFNLYPLSQKPKPADEQGRALGFKFAPYLYITGETLKEIEARATNEIFYIWDKISKVIFYSSSNKKLIKYNYIEYTKHHRRDNLRIMSNNWDDVTSEILSEGEQ